MSSMRCGFLPMRWSAIAPLGAILGSLLTLTGCSGPQTPPPAAAVYSWLANEPPAPPRQKRDVEDDGIDAQTPPSFALRLMPDDPRQPWSRNYGKAPASAAISSSDVYHGTPPAAVRKAEASGTTTTRVASGE